MTNSAKFDIQERKGGIHKTVIALLLVMAFLLSMFVYKVLQPRVMSPKEMVNAGAIMFQLPREISDFQLSNKNGGEFSNQDLKGQWTLVFFGFTYCPDICPITLALFDQLNTKLSETSYADDTKFLLVSVDPARDTPEKLKEYVEYFNPNFEAVTGDFVMTKRFANQLNVAFRKVVTNQEAGDYTIDHGGNVALINPDGRYQGFYKPPLDIERMFVTYQSFRLANN